MKTTERNAQDIFRRYWQRFRLLRAARWLGCMVCLMVLVPRIWRGSSTVGSVVIFLLYLLYLWALRLVNSLHFMSLNLILNRDCDAVTFTEVSRLLMERLGTRSTGMARLNYAQGLYWSGRFEEAERQLTDVELKRKNEAAALLLRNLKFNCMIQRKDIPVAEDVRREVQTIAAQQKNRKDADYLLLCMDAALAVQREDWDACRALLLRMEEGYRSNIQKVSAAWQLANADFAQGETENAQRRLQFIIEQGGTLYMVEPAKSLLETRNFS